jgi:hypothetical protein
VSSIDITLYQWDDFTGEAKHFSTDNADANGIINFNNFGTSIQMTTGAEYAVGDYLILIHVINPTTVSYWPSCDCVAVDPAVQTQVSLSQVLNDGPFEGRMAGAIFMQNPNRDGKFFARVQLWDDLTNFPNSLASMIFYNYDNSNPTVVPIDLNRYKFADKADAIRVDLGLPWLANSYLFLLDSMTGDNPRQFDANADRIAVFGSTGTGFGNIDLNKIQDSKGRPWNDRAAGLTFSIPPYIIAGNHP